MRKSQTRLCQMLISIGVIARTIRRADKMVIEQCSELVMISRDLDTLLAFGADTEDIKEYQAIADRQARIIEDVSETPASTIEGLMAKSQCALLKPIERGFDGGILIGISVCRDLLALRDRVFSL